MWSRLARWNKQVILLCLSFFSRADWLIFIINQSTDRYNLNSCKLSSSNSRCQTANLLKKWDFNLCTFWSSRWKSEKSYRQCSRHFSLIFVYSKFTGSFLFIYFRHLTNLGSCYCKMRLVVPRPLWQYYDAIYHQ